MIGCEDEARSRFDGCPLRMSASHPVPHSSTPAGTPFDDGHATKWSKRATVRSTERRIAGSPPVLKPS
jgi:hypothetical protein